MAASIHTFKTAALACVAALASISSAAAAEPPRIVFKNGGSILVSAVTLQGANLVVTTATEGYTQGQIIQFQTVDHVYGERPVQINQGIALLLWDNPREAIKVLEPVASSQRATAKIPGNFWLEAASALLVAHAVNGNESKVTEIGKQITDATPAQGIDPFESLGKALLTSANRSDERLSALKDLTVGNRPADVSAYAAFYAGNMLKDAKKNNEALESYLFVPCLFPSGGLILNAAAEIRAAEILTTLSRREEAVALLTSAFRVSVGTVLADEAKKRLESLK